MQVSAEGVVIAPTNGTNRTSAPAPKPPVSYPLTPTLIEAIKGDLRALLDMEGFDHRTLSAIEKTARAFRDLILGRTNVRLQAARAPRYNGIGVEMPGGESIADPVDEVPLTAAMAPYYAGPGFTSGAMGIGSLGGGQGAENFGANLHKELSGALQRRNPVDVVKAIAEAKSLGLDDLAQELRDTLLPGKRALDISSLDEPAPTPIPEGATA